MASRRSSINKPETGDENGRPSFSERVGTGSRRPSFAEPRTPGPETANSLHPDHAKSLGLGNENGNGKGKSGRNPSSRHSRAVASHEIAQTVNIMRENIQSLAERGERLENLESRTESLALAARGFRKSSNRVRKIIWWKEMKMRLIIALVILIVVGLTVLSIVQALRPRHQEDVQLHVQVQAVPPKVTAAPVASPSPSPTAISTASATPTSS
ncbi:hypothetical protein H0H93_008850 [Arthromyces matolae]|nr:hypothetical protein H0H93_008850 [Arthromyces matolae]